MICSELIYIKRPIEYKYIFLILSSSLSQNLQRFRAYVFVSSLFPSRPSFHPPFWKNVEKCGNIQADMAGLGKYCTGGYGRIGVYRVKLMYGYHMSHDRIIYSFIKLISLMYINVSALK